MKMSYCMMCYNVLLIVGQLDPDEGVSVQFGTHGTQDFLRYSRGGCLDLHRVVLVIPHCSVFLLDNLPPRTKDMKGSFCAFDQPDEANNFGRNTSSFFAPLIRISRYQ